MKIQISFPGKYSKATSSKPTHFWLVPWEERQDVYAYIEDFKDGCVGWGKP